MDLIWRSEKIIKFGAARKKIKFGDFCHFAPDFLRAKIFPNKVFIRGSSTLLNAQFYFNPLQPGLAFLYPLKTENL